MFILAHLSDIHLSPLPEPNWQQLASKRILGYLNWKQNRKHNIGGDYLGALMGDLSTQITDHTVVTGDLINIALPKEIENASSFLKALGPPKDITAVCGNHDAYVPGALSKVFPAWQMYLRGDDSHLSSVSDYPLLRKRGEVSIIACNSAGASAPFLAVGYFREKQAERLAEILEQTRGTCRVILIHHPPVRGATHWHKRLIGLERFQRVVRKVGAELILHGHTHLDTVNQIEGRDGKVPVVCVPAAGNSPGGPKPAGRYNLYRIERGAKGTDWRIELQAHGFGTDHDGVTLIERKLLMDSQENA